MPSAKEYLDFVLEQLSDLSDISYKSMMGEYIIYYQGKIIGGIYDNRLLIKPTKTAKIKMPDSPLEQPYENAKEMLLVENMDNREFLNDLLNSIIDELPAPKKRRKIK